VTSKGITFHIVLKSVRCVGQKKVPDLGLLGSYHVSSMRSRSKQSECARSGFPNGENRDFCLQVQLLEWSAN